MPITVKTTAQAGVQYGPITVGGGHLIHQVKLDVSALSGAQDADGYLPVGTVIDPSTGAVPTNSATGAVFIGPEPVKLGEDDHFANAIFDKGINRAAVESNLGRVLSADELAAIAKSPFILF